MPVSALPSVVTANAGTGTTAVYFSPANPAVNATFSGSIGVYYSPSVPTVAITTGSTLAVSLDPGHELGSIKGVNSTVAVYFDRGNPSVNVSNTGTLQVFLPDTGHELGTIRGNTNTLTVFLPDTGHELGNIRGNTNTLTVFLPDTGHELGSIRGITNTIAVDAVTATGGQTMDENYKAQRVMIVASSTNSSLVVNAPSTGTFQVFIPDTGHTLGKVDAGTGTFQVFLPDTGHELGSIRGNTNTLTVFLPDTGHTLGKVDAGTGTFTVKTDPGYTLGKVDQGVGGTSAWLINAQHTASIFTISSTYAGNSVSGGTIISPSANYNFKIFAFSLTTTAQTNMFARFTNGAGTGPTEYWRVALQAPTQGVMGANLAVTPPGHLWATGTNTTLSLVLDSASLVHYSVSYIKETA